MSAAVLRFELPGGGRALFTTRAEGSFAPAPASAPGDGAPSVAIANSACARALALTGAQRLARGRQVHGRSVRRVRSLPVEELPAEPADGQATALQATALMVVSADCLPVALGSEGAVAMLHAGWRGLAAGVLEEGVRALRELAGGRGEEMGAVIGPGAGPCCYEVGPEVRAAFGAGPARSSTLDLRALAQERLAAAGVPDVRVLELCTICDERFYSHRREGERAGRQAGLAWLS